MMVPQLAKALSPPVPTADDRSPQRPRQGKCDGAQSLTPDQFDELMGFIRKEVEFFGKKMN